jgi:hypothetical protein
MLSTNGLKLFRLIALQNTRGIESLGAIIIIVIVIVAAVALANYYGLFTPPQPPPVEIVDLRIAGKEAEASVANNSYTDITFRLKHNDGLKHTVTVIFGLTTDGARHVSIITAPGHPLSQTQTGFQYDKVFDATDAYFDQKVLAWAHMKGLKSVSVPINISLLVDGQPVGGTKSLTLHIST